MEACLNFLIKVLVFGLLYLDEGVLPKITKVTIFSVIKSKLRHIYKI